MCIRDRPGSRCYADYSIKKLNECLAAIRAGEITTRVAETTYGIPRRTIINKMKGHHTSKPGKPTVFSEEEEKVFVSCVIAMSDFGFPVDECELRYIVSAYLNRIGREVKQFTNNMPGVEWVRSFLKRHSEQCRRFAMNIKKSRASIDEKVLTEYIRQFKNHLSLIHI